LIKRLTREASTTMNPPAFFRPRDAWVGDVIPWSDGNELFLFYLHERRVSPKPGTPWHLVTTADAVTFEDRGEAFGAGGAEDLDFNAYTGSIVRDADGIHHLFYTGQNPRNLGADGRALQLVMHATSSDGMTSWVRHPEHTFGATEGYESGDWRDPFVFHDPEAGVWRMLIAARHVSGPERRRGVIAQCVSRDLVSWEPAEPFWDPRRYITHECPEVFQMGDWWYLVYSEFSESFTTRYRVSHSPTGPWHVPAHDSLDGRAFYAAKSAELGGRRFFFGWIATRDGDVDSGPWQWAGTLSVLEAQQQPDGSLDFALVPEFLDSFDAPLPASQGIGSSTTLDTPDGYLAALSAEPMDAECRVSATIDIGAGTVETGLLLRASSDGDTGYVLRLEPRRGRVVVDRWPRQVTGGEQWQVSGDVPYDIALERPCELEPGLHTIDVVTAGDICVATIDGRVTLSTRVYDHPSGHTGFFVGEGRATLVDMVVSQRSPRSDVEGRHHPAGQDSAGSTHQDRAQSPRHASAIKQ
jgi:beta-fructofuranosidase